MIRLIAAAPLAMLVWFAGVAALIIGEEPQPGVARADVALVLGAAVHRDGTPSPVFAGRLEHGVALYRRGAVRRLLITGGKADGLPLSEAAAGWAYAEAHGVPAAVLLAEDRSRTTQENLAFSLAILRRERLRTVLLVSDPLHLPRATRMARDLGMDARPSPTPTSRYRTARSRIPFLLRESFFLTGYWLTGR